MNSHGQHHTARLTLSGIIIILLFILLQPGVAFSADKTQEPTVKDLIDEPPAEKDKKTKEIAVTKAIPQDEFNRGTPRSSVEGIADALNKRDYERAMNYLDMRNVPPEVRRKGTELARQLKIVADRSLWVDVETISNDPAGHKDDGLPSYRDILAQLKSPDGQIDILMQRVPDGKGGKIWKVSNKTVSQIPVLYDHFGYGPYGDKLSRMMPEFEIIGLEVWQWVMLLIIGLASFIVSWMITRIIGLLLRFKKERPYIRAQKFLSGPARFLIFTLLLRSNFELISPTYTAKALYNSNTLLIFSITWMLTGLIELAFGRLSDRMRKQDKEHAIVLLRPAATLIKVVIILIAIISWMDNLGFNVTAMLAGLGVGGIAVGLAAQKSIENLIGAITLYAAQPVSIGDFCRAGKTLGVVEEIGLRSTTIRTLDRTLVTIPNASFANLDIENLTKRDKILYRRTIRLRNDTTPDQVRTVLDEVRAMFLSHPDVDPEPARIRFIEYGEHSLDMEIFAYIKTRDFNEYLGSVEDLNLRILDIISTAGTQLALPARSVRLEGEAVPA